MTILYVIIGALVALSLGLSLFLRVLNSKKLEQEKQRRKFEAMQVVAEAQSTTEQSFIPNGYGAE
ncbi:MAG: hypothetical protein HOL66_11545 [Rhodospirillaceae bacterium]|jgi:hypothetical protein|nr:hypothetical protein [Rhodospirillaceae bacterium]MBT5244865.1 hypothetical protein [Rhodospirillaceae bacterium]MBT5562225.1 hypothetical protein [Rhodospirillaceae bacterium]MBT6242398.1 hypothetical protein [Rhodospirillaceae bacterium]MBT7138893.1 hypothetical protein [Rhodospirillaceae bacterium]